MDDAVITEAHTRGAAAWPGVAIDPAEFARFLAERLTEGRGIDALKVEDLYLACACAAGSDAALRAFDAAFRRDIEAMHARFRYVGKAPEDVMQLVSERLFTGDVPKIREYKGRGELRTWLRVAVTRILINMTQRETRELPVEDQLFASLPGQADDPESAHLRRTYAAELRDAFGDAVSRLSSRERNVLHYACVADLGIDAIGDLYGVHRATAARWLADARAALFKHLRATLLARLKVNEREFESIVRMMLSRVELTIERYLTDGTVPR